MAISPPGDIVLDVLKAADVGAVAAARDKLAAAASASVPGAAFDAGPATRSAGPARTAPGAETFTRFEAMVLRNFLQTMLPDQASSVYGAGLSGDMWKSMMAEQLANAMADRGGIGIADRILNDYYVANDRKVSLKGVSYDPNRAEADRQDMLSTALVHEIQRRMARSLSEDALGISTTADKG